MALSFLSLLCCCILVLLVNGDVCKHTYPCSCFFPNGTGINLSQSLPKTVIISEDLTDYGGHYLFYPCYDVLMNKPYSELDSCVGYWSICRYHVSPTLGYEHNSGGYNINSAYEAVGSVSHSHFSSDAEGIYINYTWPLSAKVYLYCDKGEDKLLARLDPEIVLEYFTRNACLQQLKHPEKQLFKEMVATQWNKVSQAFKNGYDYVLEGLKSWWSYSPTPGNETIFYSV